MVQIWSNGNLVLEIESRDHNPPHAHVKSADCQTRVNLETFEILRWSKRKRVKTNAKFDRQAVTLVKEHIEACKKAWAQAAEARE